MPVPANIAELHAAFERETGMPVTLNEWRVRCWHEWLRFCEGAWGPEQIRAVVKYLRSQIATRDRRPNSLLFRNLVEAPDAFEEELNLARQAWRRSKPRVEQKVTKIVSTDAEGNVTAIADTEVGEARPAANLVAGVLEQLKKGKEK